MLEVAVSGAPRLAGGDAVDLHRRAIVRTVRKRGEVMVVCETEGESAEAFREPDPSDIRLWLFYVLFRGALMLRRLFARSASVRLVTTLSGCKLLGLVT